MAISAVGTLLGSSGVGTSTLAISPATIGDAFLLGTVISSATITAASVASSKCKWRPILLNVSDATMAVGVGLFLGVATATGADTATLTGTSAITATNNAITAQAFTSGLGSLTQWAFDNAVSVDSTASTLTLPFPTVPITGVSRLGVGFGVPQNNGTAGSTTGGFLWQNDAFTDQFVYNLLTGSMSIPNGAQSPTGRSVAIAALLSACRPAPLPMVNGGAW